MIFPCYVWSLVPNISVYDCSLYYVWSLTIIVSFKISVLFGPTKMVSYIIMSGHFYLISHSNGVQYILLLSIIPSSFVANDTIWSYIYTCTVLSGHFYHHYYNYTSNPNCSQCTVSCLVTFTYNNINYTSHCNVSLCTVLYLATFTYN